MSEPRTDDTRIRRIVARDPNGDLKELQCDVDGVLAVSGCGGGGGGAARAANHTTQIAQIGEVQASPTANTVLDRLKTIASKIPGLGAATSANSLPVVIATDSAVIGATDETAPGTDTAAAGLNGRLQRLAQNITSLIGKLPSALGSTTSANSLSVVLASDEGLIGSKTETAPSTDTASSGINGRLQRVAQRLSTVASSIATLNDQLPGTLGQSLMINSLSVTVASDQTAVRTQGSPKIVAVTPTLDTSAYTAGDVLFATTAVSSVFPANGGRGVLHSIVVNDKDDQKPVFDLYFLKANTSIGTINAAPSITDAGADDIIGRVSITSADYKDLGGCSVAVVPSIGQVIETGAATTSLWVAAVLISGTPTHTASGLVIKLGFVDLSA